MDKCIYDPSDLVDVPLGQFHCPLCGEMVLAGASHPLPTIRAKPLRTNASRARQSITREVQPSVA